MTMQTFSIIVPVYKVEKYLPECIDSILAQTYTDFELLLIDDGSPDNSGRICDEYADRDSRIRVFHKDNGGVSSARNLGIDNAKGEWIMFVDSDDKITPDCLDVCMSAIENQNLDLLQYKHSQTIDYPETEYNKALNYSDYIKMRHPVCVGGAIFKSDIIHNSGLRFDERIKLGEDQLFIYDYIFSSNKCMYIDKTLYYYRENEQSATNNMKRDDIMMSIDAFLKLKQKYPDIANKINEMLISLFFDKAVIQYTSTKDLVDLYSNFHINKCPNQNSLSIKIFFYSSIFNKTFAVYWAKYYNQLKCLRN